MILYKGTESCTANDDQVKAMLESGWSLTKASNVKPTVQPASKAPASAPALKAKVPSTPATK